MYDVDVYLGVICCVFKGFCSGHCLFTTVHGFDPPAATAQSDMSPKSHAGRSRLFVLVSYPCYPLRVVVDNKNVE